MLGEEGALAPDADCEGEIYPAQDYAREFAGVLSSLEHRPMLVIDRNRRIIWSCNRAAELLDDPMPLCIREGRLVVEDEVGPGRFDAFLGSLDLQPRRFLVRGRNTVHWAMLVCWRTDDHDRAIYVVCNLSVPHSSVADCGIATDFGLTRAETEVLGQFAGLRSPKEIASVLGVSLSTVRSHIKQIYAKTGVQTGIQLNHLLHTYCAV